MRRIALLIIGGLVGLAACGGGDDTAGGGATAPVDGGASEPATGAPDTGGATLEPDAGAGAGAGGDATADQICESFTAEMAEQVLATPVQRDDGDDCSYVADNGSSATIATTDPSGFDISREAFDGTDVPGLGQAAFNSDTGLFVVVNDELALQIIVVTTEGGFGVDQDAALELAQLVVPNLG